MDTRQLWEALYRLAIIVLLWIIAGAVVTNDFQVLLGCIAIVAGFISNGMIFVLDQGGE